MTRFEKLHNTPLFPSVLDWWEMTGDLKLSALRLNTPDFSLEDELQLKSFFENSQEIFL